MTEIDWHKVHVARLAACCQRAAADLNLSITSPFILKARERDELRFVALFPRIGPRNGTLVCLAADWDTLSDIAQSYGYSCVGVLPESCASYDPAKWAAFIKEWDAPSTDA